MTFDFSGRSMEDTARIGQMKAGWDAYYGRFAAPLQGRPRKTNDAVAVNRCKPIVDKAVSYLFGKEVTFQAREEDSDPATDYLESVWKANRKMTLLQKLAINGGVTGHVFLKIVPAQPYFRLVALDPTTVSVTFPADDIDTVTCYTIEYEGKDAQGANVQYRQLIEQDGANAWSITDQQLVGGKTWVTTDEVRWPYEFSPIVHCQNLPAPNEFWGLSDIPPDLIQLNRDLNFVLSNVQRIIKFHAHPKTWISGLGGNRISTAPDETLILPEGAQMGALEMESDLSSSLNFAAKLETAMDILSRTPVLALGDMSMVPSGTISGSAIELLLSPIVEKIEVKRRLYGDMLEELNRRLLVIGGHNQDLEIYLHWPAILPEDPQAMAAVAQQWLGMGVSHQTAFGYMGLDWTEENEKLAAEKIEATEAADPTYGNDHPNVEQPLVLVTSEGVDESDSEGPTSPPILRQSPSAPSV